MTFAVCGPPPNNVYQCSRFPISWRPRNNRRRDNYPCLTDAIPSCSAAMENPSQASWAMVWPSVPPKWRTRKRNRVLDVLRNFAIYRWIVCIIRVQCQLYKTWRGPLSHVGLRKICRKREFFFWPAENFFFFSSHGTLWRIRQDLRMYCCFFFTSIEVSFHPYWLA